ncbi:MAG TPA: GNAT family N-acetyltransferase [Jatrophihabitantaceae bacterium]
MSRVEFSDSTADVDWAALKAALAADSFDNGRTPQEYRISHEQSFAVVFARSEGSFVGNGRVLSDGVCNAYIVDIWTATPHRRTGIGSEIVRRLLASVPGQHAALFTDDMQAFYRTLGFEVQPDGMSLVVGSWLNREHP